jgi:hypothetical protein
MASSNPAIALYRYSVPPEDTVQGWGIFLIDSVGTFTCVTDYGNYAFAWRHTGYHDFRRWIVDMGERIASTGYCDYLCSKLGRETAFDPDHSFEKIARCILESRREGRIPADATEADEWARRGRKHPWYYHFGPYGGPYDGAREQYDLAVQLRDGEISPDLYVNDSRLCDAYEYLSYDYPADLKMFATRLMPRLAAMVRQELEAEGLLGACYTCGADVPACGHQQPQAS